MFGTSAGTLPVMREFAHEQLSEAERLAAIQHAAPDVAKHLPLSFESSLDNPCFRTADGALRCLPAFFIAGAMQCGTGALWKRLTMHSLVPSHHDGASHWWTLHPRSRELPLSTPCPLAPRRLASPYPASP